MAGNSLPYGGAVRVNSLVTGFLEFAEALYQL
jgi:hypothetical protein